MLAEIASNIVIESSAEYRGLPVSSDRTAWVNLPEDLRAALIAEGENYLGYAYPQILATDYMEFTRTGNRVHYEDKQFARRTALCALVLAECAEYKGRFLDDIVNGIFLRLCPFSDHVRSIFSTAAILRCININFTKLCCVDQVIDKVAKLFRI